MPITKLSQINNTCYLAIWRITETVAELSQKLSQYPQINTSELETLNIEKQQKEWLSSRLLIAKLCQTVDFSFDKILKDEFGKPFLLGSENNHISISHSFPYSAAVLHTEKSVGIDIELINPKLAKIAVRMFHAQELEWATTIQDFALLWCAKEAMYKWYGRRGIDFKKHLRVLQTYDNFVDNLEKSYQGNLQNPETETWEIVELINLYLDDYQIVICY
jgi:phosphopantetheinyl transferase